MSSLKLNVKRAPDMSSLFGLETLFESYYKYNKKWPDLFEYLFSYGTRLDSKCSIRILLRFLMNDITQNIFSKAFCNENV